MVKTSLPRRKLCFPSGFANLNWEQIEKNFDEAQK